MREEYPKQIKSGVTAKTWSESKQLFPENQELVPDPKSHFEKYSEVFVVETKSDIEAKKWYLGGMKYYIAFELKFGEPAITFGNTYGVDKKEFELSFPLRYGPDILFSLNLITYESNIYDIGIKASQLPQHLAHMLELEVTGDEIRDGRFEAGNLREIDHQERKGKEKLEKLKTRWIKGDKIEKAKKTTTTTAKTKRAALTTIEAPNKTPLPPTKKAKNGNYSEEGQKRIGKERITKKRVEYFEEGNVDNPEDEDFVMQSQEYEQEEEEEYQEQQEQEEQEIVEPDTEDEN